MRRREFITLVAGAAAAGPIIAHAQTYPSRTITIIVPFPPGGVADFAARPLAAHLSDTLRQNVVVENKGGAGGGIGHAYARQPVAFGNDGKRRQRGHDRVAVGLGACDRRGCHYHRMQLRTTGAA